MRTTTFWTWFLENELDLREALDTVQECPNVLLFNELSQKLVDYCEFFGYEMRGKDTEGNGKYTLTISCAGQRDYFMVLQRLVDAAPKLSFWSIKAFVEPKGSIEELSEHPFVFPECTIIPKAISFQIWNWCLEEGIFDISLFLPLNLKEVEEEKLQELLYFVFQDLWGEKFVGQRINAVFLHFKKESQEEYIDLLDLQEFLEILLK